MKMSMVTLLAGISLTALLAGGCATNNAVKKDGSADSAASMDSANSADGSTPEARAKAAAKAKADAEAQQVAEAKSRAAAQAQAQAEAKAKADAEAAAMAASGHGAGHNHGAGMGNGDQDGNGSEAVARRNAANGAFSALSEAGLSTVYFDFDKSDLRQDARDTLSKSAETILKTMPDAKIQIEGHCDERGSAEYNLALGERRAKSAQKYLSTLSVKAENLSIISYGKEKPAVTGSDEAAWAKNRRAELVIAK